MHVDAENLPIMFQWGQSSLRGAEWGGMMVLLYTLLAGTDMKHKWPACQMIFASVHTGDRS